MKIELRLHDGQAPPGEVRALDESRISGALHEISIRLGRERVEMTRPGRSTRSVEELCEVRLVGLASGSTVLHYAVGPVDETLDLPELDWQEAALSSVFLGLARDERPDDVSDDVADSVGALAQALRTAAPRVDLRVGARAPLHIVTSQLHRDVWSTPFRSVDDELVSVVGVLEKVDLHTHQFRLRDDVGNTLELADVVDARSAASLIGARVAATGLRLDKRGGHLAGLKSPSLSSYENPLGLARSRVSTRLGAKPGPDPDVTLDLSDEEFDNFMRAMGR